MRQKENEKENERKKKSWMTNKEKEEGWEEEECDDDDGDNEEEKDEGNGHRRASGFETRLSRPTLASNQPPRTRCNPIGFDGVVVLLLVLFVFTEFCLGKAIALS